MTLASDREVANTKRKLQLLEQSYEEARTDTSEDPHVREITLESLMRLINQLKEEIARYEVRHTARR